MILRSKAFLVKDEARLHRKESIFRLLNKHFRKKFTYCFALSEAVLSGLPVRLTSTRATSFCGGCLKDKSLPEQQKYFGGAEIFD